jgi:hypothetical protein
MCLQFLMPDEVPAKVFRRREAGSSKRLTGTGFGIECRSSKRSAYDYSLVLGFCKLIQPQEEIRSSAARRYGHFPYRLSYHPSGRTQLLLYSDFGPSSHGSPSS